MKIFVLTPIYATTTSITQGATPVVHYFTREWVKCGHEVTVFNFVARYPRFLYWIGRLFQHQLNTRLGILVPVQYPKDEEYVAEGVNVFVRCLNKRRPHFPYSKKQLQHALNVIVKECDRTSEPDWFIGHWDNPQLELLNELKKRFNKPTCLVLHDNNFDFKSKYGIVGEQMLNNIDVLGFRSFVGQRNYELKYGKPKHAFVAFSGVSELFLKAGMFSQKVVRYPVHNFVFVGSLIARKYPSVIVNALTRVYPAGDFTMTFIGDGAERDVIEKQQQLKGNKCGELYFTGRIPREQIISHLQNADVFVMISRDEIFGLVYLEAMALGVIPIGSRNEGIDGIIEDGENGFLCKAGDVDDLASVITRIKYMTKEQLEKCSNKARETALRFSDEAVAKIYIDNLKI